MSRAARSARRRTVVIILTAMVAAGCVSGYHKSDKERRSGASPPAGHDAKRPKAAGGARSAAAPPGGRNPRDLPRFQGPAANRVPPVNCARSNCIALTFDDGPGPYTGKLLDMLAARRVRSTFFVLGTSAAREPGMVRRISQEGHEIANHTYDHLDLTGLTASKIQSQLLRTQRAVHAASGLWPRLMRPPYGSTNKQVSRVARQLSLPQILWTVDTMDWRVRKAAPVAAKATRDPRRGSIILLHDIHRTSVDAVPRIVDRLRHKGFELVTVSQLYGGRPFAPGKRYLGPSS